VLLIPAGTGGTGRAAVREFYANHFLPNIPPDFELINLAVYEEYLELLHAA
jgi:hypothetical protein